MVIEMRAPSLSGMTILETTKTRRSGWERRKTIGRIDELIGAAWGQLIV